MGSNSMSTATVIEVCNEKWKEFTLHDFTFTLEMIQDLSSSQQEFWESMTTLIRYSLSHIRYTDAQNLQEWQRTLAFAMIEVFWKQEQSDFVEQIERAKCRPTPKQVLDCWGPFSSDAEILAHTMIESLCLTWYQKRALELYETLIEQGIKMRGRFLEHFILTAVSHNDGNQLERIGSMLLRQEKLYRQSLLATSIDNQSKNRPMIMSAKLMDSFIQGACENELYELARAVFDCGLEANQKYRSATFAKILNSYSVKEFGFDIVDAANTIKKHTRNDRRSRRRKGIDVNSAIYADRNGSSDTASISRSSGKALTVADPKDIEKYISAMESLEIKPSMMMLNILVKLYLEMAQYKVPEAPAWKEAFRRYNPLGLQPDVVTHNTLLAYYEKHKDLTTMRKIYDDMAGTPKGGWIIKPKRARRQHWKRAAEQEQYDESTFPGTKSVETPIYDGDANPQDRIEPHRRPSREEKDSPLQHIRSNRDIYTYNTMLHALLQHAVETKDIASIGQCFHDMELDGISADTVTFNTNVLYHISRGDHAAAMQVFRSMNSTVRTARKFSTGIDDPWLSGNTCSTDSCSNRASTDPSLSKPIKSTPSFIVAQSWSSNITQGSDKRAGGDKHTCNKLEPTQATPSLDAAKVPRTTTSLDSPPTPDIVTFTSLISGFGHSNKMGEAIRVFMEMTKLYKIEPNLKTYSALAAGLRCAGDHDLAERLWGEVLKEEGEESMKEMVLGHLSENRRQLNDTDKGTLKDDELELFDDEKAERLLQQLQMKGETMANLTVMERRQLEARRKMYRDSLEK
ncbi:hypothetical protein BGX27_007369 [Mortierella sp. AM989]|nr:hypothetical protein BGX27_007369 [Mortierella sp. AM989]